MKQHRHYQKGLSTAIRHNLLKSRGDTLIEVLITFFVIAVGILGASSMQIVALQNVNGASSRDQAVIIAENLAESIRAGNFVNLPNTLTAPLANIPSGNIPGNFTVNMNANGNNINLLSPPANLQITRAADGVITINNNGTITTPNPITVTVTIRWDEDRDGDNGTNCPVITSADLDCYQAILTL